MAQSSGEVSSLQLMPNLWLVRPCEAHIILVQVSRRDEENPPTLPRQ